MAAKEDKKILAKKLYQQGKNSALIAQNCEITQRTAQRWIKDFQKEKVIVTGIGNNKTDQEVTEPIAALKQISETEPGQNIELTMTSRIAVRLLNLTERAVVAVEDCLQDSNCSYAVKLKAADLVGQWVGLKNNDAYPIVNVVSQKLGLVPTEETFYDQDSQIDFIPYLSERVRREEQAKFDRETLLYLQQEDDEREEKFSHLKLFSRERDYIIENYSGIQDIESIRSFEWFDGIVFCNIFQKSKGREAALQVAAEMLKAGIIDEESYKDFVDEES